MPMQSSPGVGPGLLTFASVQEHGSLSLTCISSLSSTTPAPFSGLCLCCCQLHVPTTALTSCCCCCLWHLPTPPRLAVPACVPQLTLVDTTKCAICNTSSCKRLTARNTPKHRSNICSFVNRGVPKQQAQAAAAAALRGAFTRSKRRSSRTVVCRSCCRRTRLARCESHQCSRWMAGR